MPENASIREIQYIQGLQLQQLSTQLTNVQSLLSEKATHLDSIHGRQNEFVQSNYLRMEAQAEETKGMLQRKEKEVLELTLKLDSVTAELAQTRSRCLRDDVAIKSQSQGERGRAAMEKHLNAAVDELKEAELAFLRSQMFHCRQFFEQISRFPTRPTASQVLELQAFAKREMNRHFKDMHALPLGPIRSNISESSTAQGSSDRIIPGDELDSSLDYSFWSPK